MPVYSHSRLSAFEDCRLKYKLTYIDRIARDTESIEAFLGSRFHDVMETLYEDLPVKTHSLEELLADFEDRWAKEYHDGVVINHDRWTADDYRAKGRTFIEHYYKRYYPFTQSRVLGLERKIDIDLDETGRYRLMGYIDRLAQAEDGAYEIHDYKTSSGLPEQKKLDGDRQLALYQIGVESAWRDVRAVRLIWHFVAFDKEMTSSRTGEELERVKTDTIRLIDAIESTPPDGFEPHESALCDWCPFWAHCPLKRHLAKVEELPANEFLNDDGVKLVNSYAALDLEKKRLKDEIEAVEEKMEKIKEAAVAYSRREGARVLKGSGHVLKISDRSQISAPSKGTAERADLEKILREAGHWDEVSGLDPFALVRAIKEKKWEDALLERVRPYIAVENKLTVTLSPIKEKEEES
jgi:putative RecB family exonuclease